MQKKLILAVMLLIVIIIPFTLPKNNYSNKTRYIYENKNISSYSVNTNDFYSSGMIYTAFVDKANNIFYQDINYTHQNIEKSKYTIKQTLTDKNTIKQVNTTTNQTDYLNGHLFILDYMNIPAKQERLFFVGTGSSFGILITNENGNYISTIPVPMIVNSTSPEAFLNSRYLQPRHDIFFHDQANFYLVYENNSRVTIAKINLNNYSLITKMTLSYGDFFNTQIYNGNLFVGFRTYVVEIASDFNGSLAIKHVISSQGYRISNFSPFNTGVYLFIGGYYDTAYLWLVDFNTNTTIEIQNVPFYLYPDMVAINNNTLFYDDSALYDSLHYISFSYNLENRIDTNTSYSLANYSQTISEKSISYHYSFFGSFYQHNIELIQLKQSGEYFLLSSDLAYYSFNKPQLNIYVNSFYTFPDLNPPPVSWIDSGSNLVSSLIINNLFFIVLFVVIIMIVLIVIFFNQIVSSLNEIRLRKKAQQFIENERTKTVTSKKKIVSLCPNCGFSIIYGEFYCQKCGNDIVNKAK